MSKTCFKCCCEKPLNLFYRHSGMADGHLNKCIECTKADVSAHRHGAGRERVLNYDRIRAHNPTRKERAKSIIAEWAAKHPDRRAAHGAVARAIRSGALKPWPTCFVPECSAKPEAHHPDYSRPLDVVWLCPSHHKQAHALCS